MNEIIFLPEDDYLALGRKIGMSSPLYWDDKFFGEIIRPAICLGKGVTINVNGKTFGEGTYHSKPDRPSADGMRR